MKSHRGKWIALVVLLLVGAYGFGAVHFTDKFYPNTTINGVDMSGLDVRLFNHPDLMEKSVEFRGPDVWTSMHPRSVVDAVSVVGEVPQQPSGLLWPIEIFRPHTYQVDYNVTFMEDKLEKYLLDGGFDPNGRAPKNAKVVVDETGAHVVDEEMGTKVDMKKLLELAKEGLKKAVFLGGDAPTVVDVTPAFPMPDVYADDPKLIKQAEALNQVLKAKIKIDMGPQTATLGPKEVQHLLKEDKDGSLQVDPKALRQWVAGLAKKSDTYGTVRTFEKTGGGTVEVPPGIYGWRMNVDKTTAEIQKALLGGEEKTMTPVYLNKGLVRGTMNDIGDTYIEIDLSRQHLWAYKDGDLIMDADVKTGMVNNYNETPRGVHMIWSRETDRYLNGSYKDGTPYNSHVDYWMPINYGGVGLHNAPWVSVFGGTEYMRRGSNGCINLDLETAKTIYKNYKNGTPVVIYESTTDYSPADETF